ncbi:MAG: hypothetical protein FWF54_10770 [Candidatus Azobacteroides sp.]|nr:hypothetical protein [Candidatus Azobacteroides sp.]
MKRNFLLSLVAMVAFSLTGNAQYTVTLKVIDLTNGEKTNPKTDADNTDANIYTWIDDGLKALNPRSPEPDNWWFPMYEDHSITPHGAMVQGDGKLEWTLTLNVAPGVYEWNPGAKSLGWKDINTRMTVFPFTGNPKFEVENDGTITGVTSVEVEQVIEYNEGIMTLAVTAPAGTQKVFVRGLYGDWNNTVEAIYSGEYGFWLYEIDGTQIPKGNETQEYKYWWTSDSWDTEETVDAEGTKRAENRSLTYAEDDIQYDEVLFWGGGWTPSSIKKTGLDQNIDISVSGNNIVVTGTYNLVKVYTFSGQSTGTTNLPSGFYIVNVDGVSQKVIVK